jgi:hypothetical protein
MAWQKFTCSAPKLSQLSNYRHYCMVFTSLCIVSDHYFRTSPGPYYDLPKGQSACQILTLRHRGCYQYHCTQHYHAKPCFFVMTAPLVWNDLSLSRSPTHSMNYYFAVLVLGAPQSSILKQVLYKFMNEWMEWKILKGLSVKQNHMWWIGYE